MTSYFLRIVRTGGQAILPVALLSASIVAQAADPQEDAVSRQRAAASTMQTSLAQQQAAVQKQRGTTSGGSFFVLPRAESMGTNMAPVAVAVAPPAPSVVDCDPLSTQEVESMVGDTAQREGLSADLLRSVMKTESGFRPCAVSSKGAMGLMQLMPQTAEQFGIQDPFDPASNLDAGARFLKKLLNKYDGDVPKALGAYNAGPGRVDAAGGVPAIPETMDYVRQIMGMLPIR